MVVSCCKSSKKHRQCKRLSDKKIFNLPRRFSKKKCIGKIKGFTMRSSCAPYLDCKVPNKNLIIRATAIIKSNNNKVKGVVLFEQKEDKVKVTYNIKGMDDGHHGFHIHEKGDLRNKCKNAGPHFNPNKKKHSHKKTKNRHVGDLGNIKSKNKLSSGYFYDSLLSLKKNHKHSIIGRTVIVHEKRDDLGKGNNDESLKTGNAGSRIGCGVIKLII